MVQVQIKDVISMLMAIGIVKIFKFLYDLVARLIHYYRYRNKAVCGNNDYNPFQKEHNNTFIKTFEIIIPDDSEEKGTLLNLSLFGEYCPKQSLQGYELYDLLDQPYRYRIHTIIQQGREIVMNYPS